MDVAGEAGHHHELRSVPDDVEQHRPHMALASRGPRILGVGRVRQEDVDASRRLPGDPLQVGRPAVDRGRIQLEVTRVEEHAGGQVDGHGAAVRDRMGHEVKAHREGTDAHFFARGHLVEPRPVPHAMFLELPLQQAQCQPGAEQGQRPLPKEIGQGADVVLVPVGQHHAFDLIAQVQDVLEVGEDQVYPEHLDLGERQAGVQDQRAPGELQDGHVAADLPDPAQEDQPRMVGVRRRRHPSGPARSSLAPRWSRGRAGGAADPRAGPGCPEPP